MLTAYDYSKHATYSDMVDYEKMIINEGQDIHGYDPRMDKFMMQKDYEAKQEASLKLLYKLEPVNNPLFNPNLIA